MAINKPVLDVIKAALTGVVDASHEGYEHTLLAVREEVETRLAAHRRGKLHRDFAAQFKRFEDWTFEYEAQTGCYSYSLDNSAFRGKAACHVFFTPDHDCDYGWVAIQVNDGDGDTIESLAGRVPFPERTAAALFAAVKPWLLLLGRDGDA